MLVRYIGLFSSCGKQSYLFSNNSNDNQKQKSASNFVSGAEIQIPEQIYASVSSNLEVSAENRSTLLKPIVKPVLLPVKTLSPDTLKPDTLKTKISETKTQPARKPVTVKPPKELPKKKNQWIALGLALLFSPTGIHRFYLGHIGNGIVQLLLNLFAILIMSGWLGAGGVGLGLLLFLAAYIWNLVDIVLIATGSLKPNRAEYRVKF